MYAPCTGSRSILYFSQYMYTMYLCTWKQRHLYAVSRPDIWLVCYYVPSWFWCCFHVCMLKCKHKIYVYNIYKKPKTHLAPWHFTFSLEYITYYMFWSKTEISQSQNAPTPQYTHLMYGWCSATKLENRETHVMATSIENLLLVICVYT